MAGKLRTCLICERPDSRGYLCSGACTDAWVDIAARRLNALWSHTVRAGQRTQAPRGFTAVARERAKQTCQRCRVPSARLDVHRIIPGECGGRYVDWNVRVLCRTCHKHEERYPHFPSNALWRRVVNASNHLSAEAA